MRHRLSFLHNLLQTGFCVVTTLTLLAGIAACAPNKQPTETDKLRTEKIAIGVNAFIWQAALETLAFIPIASSDPYGGVLATDWYNPSEEPNARFKVTVYVKSRNLRADGVQVAVTRQTRTSAEPQWKTQASAKETRVKLENAILTRARELRIAALAEQ